MKKILFMCFTSILLVGVLSCQKEYVNRSFFEIEDLYGTWHTSDSFSRNGIDYLRDTIVFTKMLSGSDHLLVYRHTGTPEIHPSSMDTAFIGYGVVEFKHDTLSLGFLKRRFHGPNFVLPPDFDPTQHRVTLTHSKQRLTISGFEKKFPGYLFSHFLKIKD